MNPGKEITTISYCLHSELSIQLLPYIAINTLLRYGNNPFGIFRGVGGEACMILRQHCA